MCAAADQVWELTAFCFSLPAGDVSLHLTTFSLQYTPPVVACVCIHLACKWSNWEIPVSTDGKHWWEYVDGTVTLELLDGKFGARSNAFPFTIKSISLAWHLYSVISGWQLIIESIKWDKFYKFEPLLFILQRPHLLLARLVVSLLWFVSIISLIALVFLCFLSRANT